MSSTVTALRTRFRSQRISRFSESVIREMTRQAMAKGAINLAQGFPDFPAPAILKKAATDCTFLVSVQVKLRGKDDVISFPARERKLEKNNYAVLLGDLVLKDDDADWFRVSDPKNVAWFLDQLEHAKKE